MSYADTLFVKNCLEILKDGYSDEGFDVRPKWEDGTSAHTIKKLHVVDRYQLTKDSIPMMTLRKAGIKNATDEILWIYQKKTSDISQLNSHIWDSWDVGDGTIGKAYGYQIGKKSQYKDPDGTIVMRDQIDQVIWDLKNNPGSRSILTNTYCHEDLHAMGLRPCAYMMTFNVTKNWEGKMVLNGMLNQRSQDTLTANNWNVIQYSILLQMLAQCVDMIPGQFTHVIADMHIYDRHIGLIKEMIDNYFDYVREALVGVSASKDYEYRMHLIDHILKNNIDDVPYPTPKFWINPDIHNFYEFTVNDVKLIDYQYCDFNPKIPVAI